MENFWRDVQYGARMLLKAPGFTAVAVVTLALGIGANTALFSVINAVLLKPLPYGNPERLVFLTEWSEQVPEMSFSVANFKDVRDQNGVFESLVAYNGTNFILTGVGDVFLNPKEMGTGRAPKPSRRNHGRHQTSNGRRIVQNFLDVEQPIIGAINGDAFSLGATLALMCDVTIASETARIADTHVKMGVVAGDGGAELGHASGEPSGHASAVEGKIGGA